MPIQPGAVLNTQAFGNRPENVEVPHYDTRAPAASDVIYPIGKRWVFIGDSEWVLLNLLTQNGVTTANWQQNSSASGTVIAVNGTANQIQATTVAGTVTLAFPTDVTFNAGNFSVPAAGASTITLGAATETGTITIGQATTTQTINIGAAAGDQTINIGSNIASANNIQLGTSNVASNLNLVAGGALGLTLDCPNTNFTGKANFPDTTVVGTATLVGGTVVVATTFVSDANSRIFVVANTPGGTQGILSVPQASIVDATSFVINSSEAADTSTVNWIIFN